jgi:hypothetical protein
VSLPTGCFLCNSTGYHFLPPVEGAVDNGQCVCDYNNNYLGKASVGPSGDLYGI